MKPGVEEWFEKARSTWQESKTLFDSGLISGAISRLYYGAFFAVTGYLTEQNIEAKSHNGIKAMFNRHLIKTGLLDSADGE